MTPFWPQNENNTPKKNSQKPLYGLIYFFFFQFGSWDHVCDRLSASEKSGANAIIICIFTVHKKVTWLITCFNPSDTVYSSSSLDIPKSDILTTLFSPTRQFRAARSRWMQFFSSKYCIPADASKHMPDWKMKILIRKKLSSTYTWPVWNFVFLKSFMVWTVKWITRKHFIVKLILATKQDFFISRPLKV